MQNETPVEPSPVEPEPVEPIVPVEPPAPVVTEEQRAQAVEKTTALLNKLAPILTHDVGVGALDLANNGDMSAVITYLQDNIPEVGQYLGGGTVKRNVRNMMSSSSSTEASADVDAQIDLINSGLTARAEAMVPGYTMPPPFLGNEVEEARGKEEDSSQRFQSQYGQIPAVSPVYRGRSVTDNPYTVSPSSTFRPSFHASPNKIRRLKTKKGKTPRITFFQ